MAVHYCPECSAFSFHGDGYAPWDVECPECGHHARQEPHPPGFDPKPAKKAPAKKAPAKKAPAKKAPEPEPVEEP